MKQKQYLKNRKFLFNSGVISFFIADVLVWNKRKTIWPFCFSDVVFFIGGLKNLKFKFALN